MIVFSGVLQELRSHRLIPEPFTSAFLSGSIVRGWGTPMSDLDVTVVAPEPWKSSGDDEEHVPLDPGTLSAEVRYVDGRRWDVEYWTTGQIQQVLTKVSQESFDDDLGPWRKLSFHELALLERLPYAVAADDGQWLRETLTWLAESAHAAVLAARSLRQADSAVEDAAGQLQAGDLDSAALSARLAFQHAVDGLTASHGQFGSLWPKWRARRMKLIASDVLSYDEYWAIETMRDLHQDGAPAWVENVVRICQRISLAVTL